MHLKCELQNVQHFVQASVCYIPFPVLQACTQYARRTPRRLPPSHHIMNLYKLILGSDSQVRSCAILLALNLDSKNGQVKIN